MITLRQVANELLVKTSQRRNPCDLKLKEVRGIHRCAYAVYIRQPDASRGKWTFSVLTHS